MQLQRKKVLGGEKDGADIAEPKSGATSLPLVTAPEKSPGILESQIEHIFAQIKEQINVDPKLGATSPLVRFPNCHECHSRSKCHLKWVGEPDYIATYFCELHSVCRTIFWNPGILEQLFGDPECWCHIAISPAFYPDESFCFVPGSCSLLKTASTKVTWILPRNKIWNPSC